MSCAVCSLHGRWPADHHGTHCRDCHASWSGRTAAHAVCCHRTFSSNKTADRHLVRGVCTDPATIVGFQLVEQAHGYRYWTPTTGIQTPGFADETVST